MPLDDYDSDDRATGENRYKSSNYRSSLSPSNQRSSILKSSLKKVTQFSDDEDDNYNTGRLSSRNRYDEPQHSNRSDIMSAKPPSGRLHSSLNNRNGDSSYNRKTSNGNYDNPYDSPTKPKTLPALTYPTTTTNSKNTNLNDSDDSITERYNKFTKKKDNETKFDSKYDSKFDIKTDSIYDKFPINGNSNSKLSNSKYDDFNDDKKYYRSDGPLNTSTKKNDFSDDNYKSLNRNNRSSSLDRLNASSALLNTNGSNLYSANKKFNSTNNINNDNGSERSYTMNSFNNTTVSVREAKSRSYLVGSLSALNGKGLLSSEELDRHFIDRKARVLIASWNMGGVKKAPTNLEELVMPDVIQTMPDLFVLGVQEFDMNQKEWEISLQEQIGPTHVKLSSYYHGSIGITIFIKRELIWFCSIVEYEHINFRSVQAPSKTKGSLLISFQLFGTLMCFITSHFMAGEGNLEHRVENYKTTINNIKLPKKLLTKSTRPLTSDGTENFDIVFWFGDLNFLATKERDKIERKVSHLRQRNGANYEDIINHDELNQVMTQDKAFNHFLEGRITFEPTYKYDVNSDNYDTSHKVRIPSYCDRILFRSRQKGSISCYHYDAIKEIKLSDHRPVFGLYEVNIRPGVDKVPLSYGEFDKQIYAAGYQRRQMFRAQNVGFGSNKPSPCVIQ